MSISTLRWLGWSLGLPVFTWLATAAFMSIPADTRGIDIASGSELFTTHCGSCHFTKPGFPAHTGPNLHDIGRSGASRRPKQSAAQYILESIVDPSAFVAPSGKPGMPRDVAAELAPNDIRNIVGFLASRGAFADYEEIKKLDIADRRSQRAEPALISLEESQLAESVLREKGPCLQCHSLYSAPEGKAFAPGLFGVGLQDAKAIRESIINPHQEVRPQYQSVTVLMEYGGIVSGRLISRSAERLVLRTLDGRNRIVWREIPLAEVEKENGLPQIRESKKSLMPDGFDKSLTSEELDAVVKLIQRLN